jgi:hypothetical protein
MRFKSVSFALIVLLALSAANQPLLAQTQFLEITIPLQAGLNPALRPPIATYLWQTYLGNPDPVEVRWIIVPTGAFNNSWWETEEYIRNNPGSTYWSVWHPYSPPDVGTSWTSVPLDLGNYVFAVQGKGAGGELDEEFVLERNMRRVQVSARTTGPLLTVTGDAIPDIVTATTTTPLTWIELDGGTPVTFCWTADASAYGLVVVGYRYSWDITDPNDPDAWDMPFTPFGQEQECSVEEVFDSGSHTFYVEVLDFDGFLSRVPIEISFTIVPVEQETWGRIKALYRK